ncbi:MULTISPECIES: hypothetical protein [Fructobacillus]|uniref:hypothetical protein n=1 Tax=Fructobacillus TaxID=559173 RepID=UPI00064DF5C6|nr:MULTISPECIES: hypothetical protein [Fructobacillus]KMK52952.1 hypothetical protein FEFB_13120 [Fructobacillus sp. EFB-N1]MCK8628049.1 hypothetical protein [Fructobacillus cardui]CAK1230345.1 unnamed protein product [Fructobacillus cardui]CAK1253862.1 unnamed protein product [Fructobacillus cardui]
MITTKERAGLTNLEVSLRSKLFEFENGGFFIDFDDLIAKLSKLTKRSTDGLTDFSSEVGLLKRDFESLQQVIDRTREDFDKLYQRLEQ